MRSYGQYCAAARALDIVGDRWSLLIVRELLLRDCRFTDLHRGLPGVATNLLSDRLRDLAAAGVLERVEAPPPVDTTLYRLTERGRGLAPVLRELVRWGLPEMVRGPGDDVARTSWFAGALPVIYDGADLADLAPLVVSLDGDGDVVNFEVGPHRELRMSDDPAVDADVVVRGATADVMAAVAGSPAALARVTIEGDADRLRELIGRVASSQRAIASRSRAA